MTGHWPTKRIAVFAYPDANSLDVVGPLQVFASATRYMRRFMAADDPARRIDYRTGIIAPTADWTCRPFNPSMLERSASARRRLTATPSRSFSW